MNQQEYSDPLDALIAAPQHHTLLFENESVRVLDTRIGPGEVTALHTHRWAGSLYVLSWSDFVRRDANGAVILDSRKNTAIAPGTAVWSPPLGPHTLENVGESELRVIAVELKKER
jgi:mannose-6-phosphate isomerase-like protein (cupin superfamily)